MSPATRKFIDNLPPGRLKRVLRFIEVNYGRELHIDDLAGVASLSPFHFARSFSKAMGQPPMRYLWRRRVDHSKIFMRKNPGASLLEVAHENGFKSHSHFCEVFKRETGSPPAAWRRANIMARPMR